MAHSIGIRREDKNRWERRVPLTPEQVQQLIREEQLTFHVEASPLRVFAGEEYLAAGAGLVPDGLTDPIVLGVKEIPTEKLEPRRVYLFFSHTIKGQKANMPMLRRLLELGCTLIDYERIVDEQARRLVFFGRHAGLAGMIDTLWALGQRLAWEGMTTPLSRLRPTHGYADLREVRGVLEELGQEVRAQGWPAGLPPVIVGFTGDGNVSRGAQEIFAALQPRELTPAELLAGAPLPGDPRREFYQVIFREAELVTPIDPDQEFQLQDYYQNPAKYRANFARFLPHLTCVVNCIYWAPRYPRLITFDDMRQLYASFENPKLRILGDISCDVEGSIQCTVKCTSPDDPVYVWDILTGEARPGVEGQGPVVLAVDNLPCELPADASESFGAALARFLPALAHADFSRSFEELQLPLELKRAVVVHQGQLTPAYQYLTRQLVEGE